MQHKFKLIIFNLVKELNIGTLIRTAYAFGCEEVLFVGRKKLKLTGTSGTSQIQAWRHFFSMAEAAEYCTQAGFPIYGVEIGGELLHEFRFDHNCTFVLGNEGRGLSDATPFCSRLITIPQWGGVPSLNVAVAGAVVMYEFQKQQDFPLAQVQGDQYKDPFFTE